MDDDGRRGGYRVIRRLAGGRESPWPGLLVSTADGLAAVLVDGGRLDERWAGWTARTDGHLLRPSEIIRTADGHDVLLPVCTERVVDFLDRRRRTGTALATGEAVNLAVSLIRGMTEASSERAADELRGTWWLTDSGRPVLASDASDEPVLESTAELLEHLAAGDPAVDDAVARTTDAMRRGSLRHDADRLEAAFFAADDPRPLGTTSFGARTAPTVSALHDRPVATDATPDRTHWSAALARHVDAEWADVVSRTTTGVWRALRRRGSRRRAPWIAGAAVAAAVLAGGLLWPAGGDDPAAGRPAPSASDPDPTEPPSPSPSPSPSTTPTPDQTAPPELIEEHTPDGLVGITESLLAARSLCATDVACLADIQESPERTWAPGAIDLAGDDRTVSLLDEFGGVAVLRVDALSASSPSQLAVIVRIDDRWLLRDVHDVAQQ